MSQRHTSRASGATSALTCRTEAPRSLSTAAPRPALASTGCKSISLCRGLWGLCQQWSDCRPASLHVAALSAILALEVWEAWMGQQMLDGVHGVGGVVPV